MIFLEVFRLMWSGATRIGNALDSRLEVVYLHEPDYVKRIHRLPYTIQGNPVFFRSVSLAVVAF